MKKYLPLFWIPPLVLILDQITKAWVVARLAFGEKKVVIPGYFDITHVRNKGAAFGMFSEWDSDYRILFFYGLTVLALGALITLYAKTQERERSIQIPLALILGGAIGNLLDRCFRGEVVDFLRLHWQDRLAHWSFFGKDFQFYLVWPSFNVADIAITCGALALALGMLFSEEDPRKKHASS